MTIVFLVLAAHIVLFVALVWLGFFVVKHKRREHLAWIALLAGTLFLHSCSTFGFLALRAAAPFSKLRWIFGLMDLFAGYAGVIAVLLLVYVVWKEIAVSQSE